MTLKDWLIVLLGLLPIVLYDRAGWAAKKLAPIAARLMYQGEEREERIKEFTELANDPPDKLSALWTMSSFAIAGLGTQALRRMRVLIYLLQRQLHVVSESIILTALLVVAGALFVVAALATNQSRTVFEAGAVAFLGALARDLLKMLTVRLRARRRRKYRRKHDRVE